MGQEGSAGASGGSLGGPVGPGGAGWARWNVYGHPQQDVGKDFSLHHNRPSSDHNRPSSNHVRPSSDQNRPSSDHIIAAELDKRSCNIEGSHEYLIISLMLRYA